MSLVHDPSKRPKPVFHPPVVWEAIRADYIRGLGSLRSLAAKHGLRLSAVESRSRREEWVQLRSERADDALDSLVYGE